jgi:hypothetical protein
VYFLYKNEYRIFKPVEITVRRGLGRRKEKNREDEPIWVHRTLSWECCEKINITTKV